ncbi:MAG: gliding motility-associated C-terminal domain-containing protein [Bacteroidota bacterium]
MRQALSLLIITFCSLASLSAQYSIEVQVDGAAGLSTSCDDIFGTPTVLYEVSVDGQNYTTYDLGGDACYEQAPRIEYTSSFADPCNPPASVEVCFRAFDNDGIIIPCAIFRSCLSEICVDLALPEINDTRSDTLILSGTDTEGELYITTSLSSAGASNDLPCDAIDLGVLNFYGTLGDTSLSNYDNICATNNNETQPTDFFYPIFNDHGVWFTFVTGAVTSSMLTARVTSDPEGLGTPIDGEVFLFEEDDCTQMFSNTGLWAPDTLAQNSFDAEMRVFCIEPNTRYYVLVDGANGTTEQGFFGLGIYDLGLLDAPDNRCDALDLGVVPEGGFVETDTTYSNFCATNTGEPFIPNFFNRASVWFTFTAPSSGHVSLEGVSNEISPIDIEFALFDSPNDNCNNLNRLYSGRDPASYDETVEFTCLDPGRRYWVLVDGRLQVSSTGLFDLAVRDLGDIRPVTSLVDTICFGDSYMLDGGIVYTETGFYTDTIKIPGTNCDSIVLTDLTVLPELVIEVEQIFPAIGPSGTDGQATVTYSGGFGQDYFVSWCSGAMTDTATNLAAGTFCCVTVIDGFGCSKDSCFVVDFVLPQVVTSSATEVLCQGDSTGSFEVEIMGSRPPYAYTWSYLPDPSLNDNGLVTLDGGLFEANDLPAGDYEVSVVDSFFDTTFVIQITEPNKLEINELAFADLSCFESCDGSLSLEVVGGVGPYDISFQGASVADVLFNDLCAGFYAVNVTDANGCVATYERELLQPNEFIANAVVDQEVSCFDGSDGIASVSTNGNPIAWDWSSGDMTEQATDLEAGTYSVLVTNADGCTATTQITVTQPDQPLLVSITEDSPITCADSEDGILQAVVSGSFEQLTFNWSDNQSGAIASNLGPGLYEVGVITERGCEASGSYLLEAPPVLAADFVVRNIRCTEPEDIGELAVTQVSGGLGPYLYALDEGAFMMDTSFAGLVAGSYDIVVEDALGCQLVIDAFVAPPPELVVDLGFDQTVRFGDSLVLSALANSDDLTYFWSDNPGLDTADRFVRPTSTGSISVRVVDSISLCSAEDAIRLLVDEDLRAYVPSAFSPNDDGVNDRFFPFGGAEVERASNFRIFNRYGGLVYEYADSFRPNDPSIGWDGRIDGELADIGVYVYVIALQLFDGSERIVQGDVTLVR